MRACVHACVLLRRGVDGRRDAREQPRARQVQQLCDEFDAESGSDCRDLLVLLAGGDVWRYERGQSLLAKDLEEVVQHLSK